MINKIKLVFNTPDKKRLLENFLSLSVLQGANYILPLITLPYLVRVLGAEKFGLLAFAQAFVLYFSILVNYGFGLSATREVSIHRENKQKLNEIFSSVTIIKTVFFIVSLLIMSVIVFSFDKFRNDWIVYYLYFFGMVSSILFPVWLFQGLEKMKYITFLNLISKLLFTVLVFVVIKEESDFYLVPVLNGLGGVISGFLALWIIYSIFKIRFSFIPVKRIIFYLKNGWDIFLSRIVVNIFNNSNIFLLGLLTTNEIVGYFSAAEKLITALKFLMEPVQQTLYPYFVKLTKDSKRKYVFVLKKLFIFGGTSTFLITLIMVFFSEGIVSLLFGKGFEGAVILVEILSLTVFLGFLSTVIGLQVFMPLNLNRMLIKTLFIPIAFHLLISPFVIIWYQAVGLAVMIVFTTTLILLYRIVEVKKIFQDSLRL